MAISNMRGIDIAMLRTFDALLRERSVSRAAVRLFLSQPAVSASLKRLRDIFDDPLFVRSSHGVDPTPRALELAPRVEAVLLELQRLLDADREFDPGTSERILRIAGSDHSSRLMLPALCGTLTAMRSRMRLFWETADYSRVVERLRLGDIDLAVIPSMEPVTGVETAMLYEDSYTAVVRRGHEASAQGMDIQAFCSAPHVVLGYGRSTLDDTIDRTLARVGRSRQVQVAVTSFSQMAEILAATDHVAVFPRRVAMHYADSLSCFEPPIEIPRYRVFLCWNARASADSAVMWLKNEMLRHGQGAPLAG